MMLLEIWLTVSTWRKGWGPRALLPWGIGFAAAFVMGMAVGASGGSLEAARPLGFLIDLGVVAGLIAMRARAPQRAEAPSAETAPLAAAPVAALN